MATMSQMQISPASAARRLALLACLGGAGCAVGPNFHRPPPPAGGGYLAQPFDKVTATTKGPAGGDQSLIAGAEVAGDWWKLYHSPGLDAVMDKALKNNSDLAAARAALKVAHQTYLAQRAVFLPTLDLAANTSQNKSSEYLSPVTNSSALYYGLQTAQLNVGYTLDVFGGLRRQTEVVKAQEDQQRFQTEAAWLTLTSNVVAAVVQEASLRAQVKAQQEIIDEAEKVLVIMRRQLTAGQIAPTDLLAQETLLAQAQAALPPLQRQLDQERDLLAYLTGQTPAEYAETAIDLDALVLPSDLPVSVPSRLVEQRPDIRQAEANLHQASAGVGVAIAARLPQITLNGSYGGASANWGQLLTSGNTAWTYGAGLAQPIFEGGALYHKQKAAEAALVQAREQYRSAVLAAFQNVADSLKALKTDAQALDAATLAEAAAKHTLEITERQFAAGQDAPIDVLNAEQAERQAIEAKVQAQAARFSDTAALFVALGGGWWNQKPDPAAS
jgi:NodT family efflux transporter outer membrane factor (OMF) lipoprotein